jgi:hypothetical protein
VRSPRVSRRPSTPSRRLFLTVLIALLLGPGGAEAGRRPPSSYPLLFQTMPGRLERSDFARLAKYDVIELTWWATETSNGFLDSLRAVRQRRPEIVTLLNLSGAVTCSNYYGDGIYRKRAWADSVASHADTWLLRDVDGDLYVLNDADTACHGGHLNYYRQDMARAFARYIAESTVLRYPNDIDGIRLDDLNENI